MNKPQIRAKIKFPRGEFFFSESIFTNFHQLKSILWYAEASFLRQRSENLRGDSSHGYQTLLFYTICPKSHSFSLKRALEALAI